MPALAHKFKTAARVEATDSPVFPGTELDLNQAAPRIAAAVFSKGDNSNDYEGQ
jgi:hypothetical protein